ELFENKIETGVLSADVLMMLAHLIDFQKVFLIFTGSQDLERRRKSYWSILLPKSRYKAISYLDRSDALHLISKTVEGTVRYHDGAKEAIVRLTAGQPFYTQVVCQSLVDRLNEARTHDATLERVDQVAHDLAENPLPQTIFLWDGLEPDDKLVLSLLAE